MIKFSPPHIDQAIIDEVVNALKSGWITTGPRTKQFEKDIAAYCKAPNVLCLNSATAGLEIILRWFGVGPNDEVIVPAYTYCATANVVMHCGAKLVFVDVNQNDFNISFEQIKKAITPNTKVIMPVDFAGLPCNYNELNDLVKSAEIKSLFTATIFIMHFALKHCMAKIKMHLLKLKKEIGNMILLNQVINAI